MYRLDRKKQKKIQNWPVKHRKHVDKFKRCLAKAEKGEGTPQREANLEAFNNYLRWFLQNSRTEICPPAYHPDILEQEDLFDEAAHAEYNNLVKAGRQTSYASVLHFVVIL